MNIIECIESIECDDYKYTYTCPVCGRRFLASSEWAYKASNNKFCSWRCLESYRKEGLRKSRAKMLAGKNLKFWDVYDNGKLILHKVNVRQIREALNCDRDFQVYAYSSNNYKYLRRYSFVECKED